MEVFNDKWLVKLHCILWRLREVDTWVLHRLIYELSCEGLFEANNWVWYGDSPRSPEVDGALAFFELTGILKREDGLLKVSVKPPECVLTERELEVISKVLGRRI